MFFLALTIDTPHSKVSVANRVIAKLIDLAVMVVVSSVIPYPAGPLLGFLYSLLGDAMCFGPFRGQSVGKKLMKLKTVHQQTARPITLRESALRNSPIGVATFFAIVPFWGWIILALIGVPLMVIEIYLMISVHTGHRLGDVMGDTEVVDADGARSKKT